MSLNGDLWPGSPQNGASASVILYVCESLLIWEVFYLVLIRQKTSRQCGQQVCQEKIDEFLKEPKDLVGVPKLRPIGNGELTQGLSQSAAPGDQGTKISGGDSVHPAQWGHFMGCWDGTVWHVRITYGMCSAQ